MKNMNHSMRGLVLFCLLLQVMVCPLWAQRTESEARKVAAGWWQSRHSRQQALATPQTLYNLPRAYVFTQGTEFLLVSKGTDEPAVLGYGCSEQFPEIPPVLRTLLSTAPSARVTAAYPPAGAVWKAVSPLLTTIRHQQAPYNRYCPYYRRADGSLSDNPCVVGCVATAMEQILTYYRRTYTLADTLKGWETPNYVVPDVLPGASVDTRLIRDNYAEGTYTEAEADAVARLSFYLGVACRMNWGEHSSGAYSQRLVNPLQRAWGMEYVHYLSSTDYDPAVYWNFLATEIQAARPVYYAGSIMRSGGHAFVLDGLDERGLFHVNWGYGGAYDGYFRLDVLAHPQPEADRSDSVVYSGFFCNQEAIVCSPDAQPDVKLPSSLPRTGREVIVENVCIDRTPQTGCYTPLRICVQNVSKFTLTTPFYVLLHEPDDAQWPEHAELLNQTGCTLAPGQHDTLLVHTLFTRSGQLSLTISSNGQEQHYSRVINVGIGGTQQLEADVPQLVFADSTQVEVHQHIANPSDTARGATYFVYDLLDNVTQTDGQVEHFVYLRPAADTVDVVRFRQLVPGRSYTLRVRRVWPIVQNITFTMPTSTGIDCPAAPTVAYPEIWYTLSGRQVLRPTGPGIYLCRKGSRVYKVLISQPH